MSKQVEGVRKQTAIMETSDEGFATEEGRSLIGGNSQLSILVYGDKTKCKKTCYSCNYISEHKTK